MDYIVITPAHNESWTIQALIDSMERQTILPKRWVVVNDSSTDDTENIIKMAQSRLPWLELLNKVRDNRRQFGGKAESFNNGVHSVRNLCYKYIANLDADASFPSDYFAYLLRCLEADPKLGVVGTPFREAEFSGYDYRFTNPEHVSGICQLFRRACLEQIGGYRPLETGGVDWVAVTSARMLGWKTKTCPDRVILHHRPMGRGNQSWGNLNLRQGRKDYMLGNGLLWEVFRCVYQAKYRPYFIGGLLTFVGYVQYAILHKTRPIPLDLVNFIRTEQARRLRKALFRIFGGDEQ